MVVMFTLEGAPEGTEKEKKLNNLPIYTLTPDILKPEHLK